jgi:Mor family transcriptional regulator
MTKMKSAPKTERNLEILQRHYIKGEAFKSISKEMNISYSATIESTTRWRKKILKRLTSGETLEEIGKEYRLPENIISTIIEIEAERESNSLSRWNQYDEIQEIKHNGPECLYFTEISRDIFIKFRQGLPIVEIANEYEMDQESVLRIIEIYMKLILI